MTPQTNRKLETPKTPANLNPVQLQAIAKLFAKGVLTPLFHSTQRLMSQAFHSTKSDEFLVFCSRQLGKTHFGLCEAITVCLNFPGSRVLYYGPKKSSLHNIINDGLGPILQFAPKELVSRHKSSHRWTIGQSELRILPLERAHVDSNRGINAKGLIVVEEGCFVKSEDFKYAWESVIEAQRLTHKPRVMVITTPSVDEDHYVHTTLLPRLEMLNAVARYTIYDNPFLPLQEIEQRKSKLTDESWRREFMCEVFRSKESVAVPEYDDSRHATTLTPPPYANWLTCIDFGGSQDPHGIALCYYDFHQSKWCVFKETLVPVNTSIQEIVEEAIKLEQHLTKGRHDRVVDGKGQLSIELFRLGFAHCTPTKGPGSFDAHLQGLRVAFQNDQIVVDSSCAHTRSQLKHGKLNKQRNDFHRTTHHCDLIAALMYGNQIIIKENPFPHGYGFNPQTHHIPPKPTHKLLQLGHKFS